MDQTRPHISNQGPSFGGSSSILTTVLVVILIITSVVATAYLMVRLLGSANTTRAVKAKSYQAVFLTNNQVYFGHLDKVDSTYVKLKDIYYLQVQQQVQPKDDKAAANAQPNVSLAKLGGELHGPEDVMYINRDQVLFWENLKEDGKVASAIKDYAASGKK